MTVQCPYHVCKQLSLTQNENFIILDQLGQRSFLVDTTIETEWPTCSNKHF